MKTINELARALGVSRQTIYNVCKKMDVSLDELTTRRHGKERLFDDEAERKVRDILVINGTKTINIFDKLDILETELNTARTTIREKENDIEKLKTELENKEREQAKTEKRISDQAEELDKLRAEVAELRENNSILIKTNATNAVTIQTLQQERARLTSAEDQEHAGGWIRRTWRKIRGEAEGTKG